MVQFPPYKHKAMHVNNRLPSFYLLASICVLSVLDLNGTQAGILFVLIAAVLGIQSQRKNEIISPVAFVIVAYLLAFPFPMLLPGLYPDLWNTVSPESLEYGMLWALRGFSALAIGYVLVEQYGARRRKQRPRDEALYRVRVSYTVYVLTGIGWLSMLAWIASAMFFGISLTFIESDNVSTDSGAGTLLQIFTLLSDLRYPFFLGFLVLRFWKKTDGHLTFLFIALVLISVVEMVVIGSKASIIGAVIVALLTQSILSIKFSVKTVAMGALAVVAVYLSFATITEYRSIMHTEQRSGRDVFDFAVQVESFKSAVLSSLPFSEKTTTRQTEVGQEEIYSRFSAGMFSLANLMEHTWRRPPYENAWESFLIPIYAIAPRFLIPEKPVFFNSGRNAQEYYGWDYGGIAVSLPGSFYYAWGYTGIIFGMAFLGGLLAYVIGRVRMMGIYSPHGIILLPFLLLNMIYVDVTFHAITTNLIRLAAILWLLHLLFPLVRGPMRRRMSRILGPIKNRSHT